MHLPSHYEVKAFRLNTIARLLGRDLRALWLGRGRGNWVVCGGCGSLSMTSKLLWHRSWLFWWSLAFDNHALKVVVTAAGGHGLDEVTVVVGKGVGLFLVNCIITDHALLIGHSKRNAHDVFDEEHDEGGPDDVPAYNEESTNNLEPYLLAIPINGTTGRSNSERSGTSLSGKNTSQESTNGGRD